MSEFCSVEEAIERLKRGEMIIVVDDEDRENEGDFVIAAEKVTPEAINFMAKYGRGLICLAATAQRLDELRIGPITSKYTARHGTAMMEPIDARIGTTTGISAYDRAQTIRLFVDPRARPEDFEKPGHVFPLRAVEGGVLRRAGHTEAASRPGAAGRTVPGRRHLRDHERRRHDGAPAAAAGAGEEVWDVPRDD
jgi:3,4-dihydroxy 2-butanone 4-phosphate synthase/GTP cyclohydrolase II